MITKALRTALGVYTLIFTFYTIITALNNGFNPYLLFLFPLPLYFIIITIREVRHFYHHLDHEFVIEGYSHLPAGGHTAFDLRFLFTQTSPSFLITVCLFSTAVSATIVRAFLTK